MHIIPKTIRVRSDRGPLDPLTPRDIDCLYCAFRFHRTLSIACWRSFMILDNAFPDCGRADILVRVH